jgi:hypothetical protein
MYAALWRVLPGPVWVKVIELVVLALLVMVVLATLVFPLLAEWFLVEESLVGS